MTPRSHPGRRHGAARRRRAAANRPMPSIRRSASCSTAPSAPIRTIPDDYRVPGFALGEEAARPDPRGFSLGESEVNFSANIDQEFYGSLTVALEQRGRGRGRGGLHPDHQPALAASPLKAGRFFSGIGYLNEQHAHDWDFADAPLPYRAFLGNQYGDDGVQLRWLAPTAFFLEFGGEVFRGDSLPGRRRRQHGVGTYSAVRPCRRRYRRRAAAGWPACPICARRRDDRETGERPTCSAATRRSRIAEPRLQMGAGRQLRSSESEAARRVFPRASDDGDVQRRCRSTADQTGWYVAGGLSVHAALARRPALRRGATPTTSAVGARRHGARRSRPHAARDSAMLEYDTSEFGRFRLQFSRDESRPRDRQRSSSCNTPSASARTARTVTEEDTP